MKLVTLLIAFSVFLSICEANAQSFQSLSSFTIARIKYGGGGDWYGDQTSLNNLLAFVRENTNIVAALKETYLEISSEKLFSFPYLYITGHGNIKFTDEEILRLRKYLTSGGFIHADDNYGMDKYFRSEMKRVFPDKEWIELPFSHGIYHSHFEFPNGLPKIHEHDGGTPNGYGLFHNGRLVVFYSFNCDLGDGWEDSEVHNNPEQKRLAALKMGTNIIVWVLAN